MILVDELRDYKNAPHGHTRWCHMASDDLSREGLRELHEMARKIGLAREWFQDHPAHPHYDLTPSKRQLAVENGATPVTSVEYIRRTSRFLIHRASNMPKATNAANRANRANRANESAATTSPSAANFAVDVAADVVAIPATGSVSSPGARHHKADGAGQDRADTQGKYAGIAQRNSNLSPRISSLPGKSSQPNPPNLHNSPGSPDASDAPNTSNTPGAGRTPGTPSIHGTPERQGTFNLAVDAARTALLWSEVEQARDTVQRVQMLKDWLQAQQSLAKGVVQLAEACECDLDCMAVAIELMLNQMQSQPQPRHQSSAHQ